MLEHKEEVTGIILAGGKAKRLGKDKGLLRVGPRPILDATIEKLASFCKETILVGENLSKYSAQIKVIHDEVPNQGPLQGILSGLKASSTRYSLVVGVDMPFLNQELLKFLVSQADDSSVIIPESPKGLEPLCAVYSRSCIEPIGSELSKRNFKIASFFEKVNLKIVTQDEVLKIDPQFLSFFNINTGEDLSLAKKIYAEGKNIESA